MEFEVCGYNIPDGTKNKINKIVKEANCIQNKNDIETESEVKEEVEEIIDDMIGE